MQKVSLPGMRDAYGRGHAIMRTRHVDGHEYKQFFCPECDEEILNFMTPDPFYRCAHNSWGAPGQKPSDRHVLDAVLAELKEIKTLLQERQ